MQLSGLAASFLRERGAHAGRGGPARLHRAPRASRRRPRGAPAPEPAPASPAGWSREPEICARTASLSSPSGRPRPPPSGAAPAQALKMDQPPARGQGVGRRGAALVTRGAERRRRDAGVGGPALRSGKMAPRRTRRRDPTRAGPSPARAPARPAEAARGAGPARDAPRPAARASAGLARRPPARQTKLTTWLPPLGQVPRKLSRGRRPGGGRTRRAPRWPPSANFKFPSAEPSPPPVRRRAPAARARPGPGNFQRLQPATDSPAAGGRRLTFRQVLDALEGDLELERVVERRRVIQHHYIVHLNLCHILKKTQTMGTGACCGTIKSSARPLGRAQTPAPAPARRRAAAT